VPNSSSSTENRFLFWAANSAILLPGLAAQADVILPKLARCISIQCCMPVDWDQIEPKGGSFDFSTPNHWIDVSRQQHLHFMLLWFGSWKNAFSEIPSAMGACASGMLGEQTVLKVQVGRPTGEIILPTIKPEQTT
jgi:hypothetical protein